MDSPILVFIPVALSISYLLLRLGGLPAIRLPRRFRAQERLQSPSVAIFRNPNTRRKSLLLALSLLLGTAVAWTWTLFLPAAMLLLLLLVISFTLDEVGEPRRLQELPATLGLIKQILQHVAAGDDLPEALGKAVAVLPDGPVQAAAKKALLGIEERLAPAESLDSLRGVNPYLDEFVSDSLRAGWQHSPALIITLKLLLKRASQYWSRTGSLRARRDRLQPLLPFARGFITGGTVMGLALLFQPPTIQLTTIIVSILAAFFLRFALENSTVRRMVLTGIFIFLLLSPPLFAFPVQATPTQHTRQGSLSKEKSVQLTSFSQSEPVKLRGAFELPECQVSTGVTGGLVNLRSGPGMHHPVIQVIPENEALTYLGQTGNFETGQWRQVMMDDEIGWIYAPLCKTAAETEADAGIGDETGRWAAPQTFLSGNPATPEDQTTLDSCQIATGYSDGWANLRSGPSMDFPTVATLPELTRLEVVEQAGDFYTTGIWYKVVAPNTVQGWIFNKICSRSNRDDS